MAQIFYKRIYMKHLLLVVWALYLTGCSTYSSNATHHNVLQNTQPCVGTTELPKNVMQSFQPVEDMALLQEALGMPEQGKLCQGKVYQSTSQSQVTLYRAWNSTNPNSQFGKWWAFNLPAGKIAQYRSDYEICYQWSPLDKMVSCTLKPGIKVVVGNGQSAECSEYLTYPVSEAQQVFLDNANAALENCQEFDGLMSWQAVK